MSKSNTPLIGHEMGWWNSGRIAEERRASLLDHLGEGDGPSPLYNNLETAYVGKWATISTCTSPCRCTCTVKVDNLEASGLY